MGSISNQTATTSFRLAGQLGGIENAFSEEHKKRIDVAIKAKARDVATQKSLGSTVTVESYPLTDVLRFLNHWTIDYWSLDVEGAEAAIIAATDFDKIRVGVMTVEHNGNVKLRSEILQLMQKNKFVRVGATNQ